MEYDVIDCKEIYSELINYLHENYHSLLLPLFLTTGWYDRVETTYYFCASKTPAAQSNGRIYVYYSDVNHMENDQTLIWKKLEDWQSKAKAACVNTRCSNDINHYSNAEAAKKELDNFLKRYSDTSKYILTHIELK